MKDSKNRKQRSEPRLDKKEIYIWGCGKMSERVLKSIDTEACSVRGFIDSDKNKQGKYMWDSYPIVSAEEAIQEKPYGIVLSMKSYQDLKKQMDSVYPETNFFPFWKEEEEFDVFNGYARKYFFEKEKNHRYELMIENAPYELGVKKDFTIKPAEELLENILKYRKSMCRYGDGEFETMFGRERNWYQKTVDGLSRRLKEIILSENPDIYVCVADDFSDLSRYKENAAHNIREYLIGSGVREDLRALGLGGKRFYDAYVSRPYMMYKDKAYSARIFEGFKRIFSGRNILMVEGKGGYFGHGNDLLKGAASVRRILCPSTDAFSKYEEILKTIRAHADKEDLLLIALGPAATLLAYDLSLDGVQALDIGQLDNEYDWFLRGVEERVEIEGKVTAEVSLGYHRVASHNMTEVVADLS